MLIQKFRLQRGWSQQQLADLSGLSVRTIQRLEGGRAASIESLKSLAAVFEVDFHTLQGEQAMSDTSPSVSHNATNNLANSPADNPADNPVDGKQMFYSATASREEEEAFRHVRQLKRWYRSVCIYLLVIPLLAGMNAWLHPHRWWVQWPALIWGAVLLAIRLFGRMRFLGPQWERQQVEHYLGRKL